LIIYAALAVLIAVGLLFPSILKNAVSTEAMQAYQLVDTAGNGGFVFVAVDAPFGEAPRQLTALVRQTLSSGAMVITASTTESGAGDLERLLRGQLSASRRTYGQAAINLGCRPGGVAYLEGLARSFASAAQGRDHAGEDLELLQLAHSFRRLDDARLFVFVTGGDTAAVRSAHSIAYANAVQVLLGVSGEEAVNTATQMWQEGRVDAILAGARTTADYESLVAGRGAPSRHLTALTLGTLFVMFIILWAFLSGPISRRRRAFSGGTRT
jgi:hypothetical protein